MSQKIEYEKLLNNIETDIKQKGFSFIDKSVLDNVVASKEMDDFKAQLNSSMHINSQNNTYEVQSENVRRKKVQDVWFIFKESKCDLRSVTNLNEFINCVMDSKDVKYYKSKRINRYFRGQQASYNLKPSLFRKKEWVENEMELNARVYCDRPNDFFDCKSTFEKLVRLKHYNQPSRLLDLTANPLVALFFACYDSNEEDENSVGVVYEAFCPEDEEKISVSSDTVTMLTAMTNTKMKNESNEKITCVSSRCVPKRISNSCFNNCLKDKESNLIRDSKLADWEKKYIDELSHQCKKEGQTVYWDDLCFTELNQCILVKPPLNTERIVRQSGCFIMCGMNPNDISSPPESLYDFFKNVKKARKVYYILPKHKPNILKQLKVLGIDEYFIFPELEREIDSVKNSYLMGK